MKEVINTHSLIGDLVNTYGILRDLSELNGGLSVKIDPIGKWFYDMLPAKLNISVVDEVSYDTQQLDIIGAFQYSQVHNLHMSQSYHYQFGLPTPIEPIKPRQIMDCVEVPTYDYLLAPHSRSLPSEQTWSADNWISLAQELEYIGYSVAFLGNSTYDKYFIGFSNEYDRPINEVLNLLQRCGSVISVVTGISHLCYVVDAKNYLLDNQPQKWGINPDAQRILKYIPELTVDEVLEALK